MKISIITPTYNRAETYLPLTIQSVITAIPPSVEVEHIIIDDASTDDTKQVIQKLQQTYTHIRYITLSHHAGPARARNVGLEISTGEMVIDLDDDDIMPYYGLEERVTGLLASGKQWLRGNACQINEAGVLLFSDNLISKHITGQWENFVAFYEGEIFAYSGTKIYVAQSLKKAGGWDERYSNYGEDFELWLRLCSTVGEPALLTIPLIFYRKKKTSLGIRGMQSGEMNIFLNKAKEQYRSIYHTAQKEITSKKTS